MKDADAEPIEGQSPRGTKGPFGFTASAAVPLPHEIDISMQLV